jgi:phosphoribosylformylglycinamidine cyclo-ligase
VIDPGRFDLAGFCVGVVRQEDLLRPHDARPGDALVGFRSSGLHSNGFSLVRRAVLGDRDDAELVKLLDEFRTELGRTLGEELLEPSRLYVYPLLAMARAGLVRSAANITGGGWRENVPRALPEGLGAWVDRSAWDPQPVFGVVADAAGLDPEALFDVLNMGIGMIAVVPRGSGDAALEAAREAGTEAVVVGRVVDRPGVHLR